MKIVVIGGGPAGMMAAYAAKSENPEAQVTLLEKNEKLGKKIFITGKGRGNLTNACNTEDLLEHYVTNPRFLYSAIYDFTNKDVIKLMEKGGCRVKIERGDRVFPVSDHAYSITDCLKRYLKKSGVNIGYNTCVKSLLISEKKDSDQILRYVTGLETDKGHLNADRIIVATGGLSYPSTGSTGDGYRFAESAGMQVTECFPSLVSLDVHEEDIRMLRGLKLKNISIEIKDEQGKVVYQDFGDLDFINQALSGPVILSASTHVTRFLNAKDPKQHKILTLHINLKPALTDRQLDERLLRDFNTYRNKELRNALSDLLPATLIPVFLKRLEKTGVDINQKVTVVSKESRKKLLDLLRNFTYTIAGTGNFREAIVTQGGVSVKEINPRTMESKKVQGLYFAGEVLDVDGYTGGFNMQMAFSTGHLAGVSAAKA
ncbi:MAG: NAD(P)/FAD-dependent oxidoreductase [Oribacterium sp.]|nr:NAD(P)/FAD-dependent oxidoreductase [Oribacterium sp.]